VADLVLAASFGAAAETASAAAVAAAAPGLAPVGLLAETQGGQDSQDPLNGTGGHYEILRLAGKGLQVATPRATSLGPYHRLLVPEVDHGPAALGDCLAPFAPFGRRQMVTFLVACQKGNLAFQRKVAVEGPAPFAPSGQDQKVTFLEACRKTAGALQRKVAWVVLQKMALDLHPCHERTRSMALQIVVEAVYIHEAAETEVEAAQTCAEAAVKSLRQDQEVHQAVGKNLHPGQAAAVAAWMDGQTEAALQILATAWGHSTLAQSPVEG